MATKVIAILAGDGIGKEIIPQAVKVLHAVAKKFHHVFDMREGLIGASAFDVYGQHLPVETLTLCQSADAILMGAVGGSHAERDQLRFRDCEKNSILALRKALACYANIRYIQIFPELMDISPLKSTLLQESIDFCVVRELLGDLYFGRHERSNNEGNIKAIDVCEYTEKQINAIALFAFNMARKRKKKVVSVDKANVLETSKLWRECVNVVARNYPDVTLEHRFIDDCAMQLVLHPAQFDVVLTSNLFGDILSDLAAALPGSLGLIPSGSFSGRVALYEPAGGSAPDIAGKNWANPIAQILCAAMMLRDSFALYKEAAIIECAIHNVLQKGIKTKDLVPVNAPFSSTEAMGDAIVSFISCC